MKTARTTRCDFVNKCRIATRISAPVTHISVRTRDVNAHGKRQCVPPREPYDLAATYAHTPPTECTACKQRARICMRSRVKRGRAGIRAPRAAPTHTRARTIRTSRTRRALHLRWGAGGRDVTRTGTATAGRRLPTTRGSEYLDARGERRCDGGPQRTLELTLAELTTSHRGCSLSPS